MELRQYWGVIWRRRWLVLAVVALTMVVSGGMFLRSRLSYEAEVRFITRQLASENGAGTAIFTWQPYSNWFGSEFLVDDYTQIVESDAFANSVLQEMSRTISLGKDNKAVTVDDIKSSLQADRKHRELRVKVTASTRDEALAMSAAVSKVLTGARMKPLQGPAVDDRPVFAQIDEATPDEVKSSRSKELLNAIIRVALGLAAALALAFLLEYLDRSVRDERDAERLLEMPVIGAIPHI